VGKKTSNEQIVAELEEVYGKGVVHIRTVQRWTDKFANRQEDFNDVPKPGRPRLTEEVGRIQEILKDKPFASQKAMARELSIRPSAMKRLLTEDLGMRKVSFKWIPHKLTDLQKGVRVPCKDSCVGSPRVT
jgi:transposase